METTKPDKTISQVFEEFLVDQEGRISSKTFSKYESIIQLYALYLENYWPGHNGDYNKISNRSPCWSEGWSGSAFSGGCDGVA